MRALQTVSVALLAGLLAASACLAGEKPSDYRDELRAAQLQQRRKEYAECLAACEKMLAHFKEARQAKETTWLKVDTLILAGQHEGALKAVAGLAAAYPDDKDLQTAAALRTGDVLRTLKKFDEARAEYERVICTYPLEAAACQSAQAGIVETHRAQARWDDALGAARVLYDAAGDEQSIRAAAQTVAQAFLSADGNLGRANEFLAYQRFGPDGPDRKSGTGDDIAINHLAKVKYPALGPQADKRFQAAVDAQPDNCDGRRARGFLYVYWGKPKEAAVQFRLALKSASLAQVPAAAQELVLVGMKAYTASFHELDRIFEYVSYGPKGKSGKENIPDPFAGL